MKMTRSRSVRALLAGSAVLLLAAACSSGSTGSTWTFVPPQPTATAGASGGPSASGTPAASTAPSGAPSSAPTAAPSGGPSGSPAASEPAASGTPAASGSPAASQGAGQTIELELTGSLSITQGGQQVTNLDVKQGDTITFKVTNTAGFAHDFFIGPADALSNNQTTGLSGIPEFSDGTQELTYTVTADTANLEFACTVPGHYPLMHGTFTVTP